MYVEEGEGGSDEGGGGGGGGGEETRMIQAIWPHKPGRDGFSSRCDGTRRDDLSLRLSGTWSSGRFLTDGRTDNGTDGEKMYGWEASYCCESDACGAWAV
jgi:hypothetical protein